MFIILLPVDNFFKHCELLFFLTFIVKIAVFSDIFL